MSRARKPFDESQYEASRAPELITTLTAKMTQIRLLRAELLDVIAEMDREQIVKVTGYSRLPHLIAEVLHLTPKQARDLVTEATQIAEHLTPTGHTTPAALPNARDALHAGLLDGEHIRAIAETLEELPDTAPLGAREHVEATLAEAARSMDAHAIREQGKVLLNHLDPDGPAPVEKDPTELRNTFTYRIGRDGRMRFTGDLEPETAAVLERMLQRDSTPTPRQTPTRPPHPPGADGRRARRTHPPRRQPQRRRESPPHRLPRPASPHPAGHRRHPRHRLPPRPRSSPPIGLRRRLHPDGPGWTTG